jgi:hypothetical protein
VSSVRLQQFESNILRARDLVGTGQSIDRLTNGVIDSSEMYRSVVVLVVAALDSYVHGVMLDRSVDIVMGRASGGDAGRASGLPIASVGQILSIADPLQREMSVRGILATRLALDTYQQPDDIGKALASVGVSKLWSSAFTSPESIKLALKAVVRRRNLIAHQCDADPMSPAHPNAMSDTDAIDSIDTIELVVRGIDKVC